MEYHERMQLHEMKTGRRARRGKRIGRGGKRGKTSGRGMKGQKARTGNSTRPEMRELIKRRPKRRGFGKNRARSVNASRVRPSVVGIAALERAFEDGERVDPRALAARGLIETRGAAAPRVKILGSGRLSKKLAVFSCALSDAARERIEAAGGSVS